jgi:hypothetical protein
MGDSAVRLWTKTITTAIAAPGEVQETLDLGKVDQIIMSSVFDYGSGGTTAKAWLQMSFDNGATWKDVINHAFLLADLSPTSVISSDVAPAAQAFAGTDGALADNTVHNGAIGGLCRVKVITTGTYAGSTTLNVWITARRRRG